MRPGKTRKVILLPDEVADWLAEQARLNGGSFSTEISRHLRKLVDADAKAKAANASAGE